MTEVVVADPEEVVDMVAATAAPENSQTIVM